MVEESHDGGGPRTPWTRAKLLRAAIDLADEQGIESLSMRKLSQELGGGAMLDVGVYPLRPGVNLVLLVRKDLADANAQDMSKILEYKVIQGYTS